MLLLLYSIVTESSLNHPAALLPKPVFRCVSDKPRTLPTLEIKFEKLFQSNNNLEGIEEKTI